MGWTRQRGAVRGELAALFCFVLVVLSLGSEGPGKSPKMSIGRRVVLGCCRWSTACGVVLIWAAPVVLIIFALLLPANAQYWGNSWGGRQQQSQQPQQPYNPYGGYSSDWQDAPI